jgi:ribokinase
MTSPEIVVVGGASTDFVVYGPRLPGAGDELTGEQFIQLAGGKGVNQAVAAARLGRSVALIARVGTDQRGDALLQHLRREGVDTQCCFEESEAETGAILLMIDHEGTKQTLTVPGATSRLSTVDIARSEGLIRAAQVLVVQFEPPLPTVLAAIGSAHGHGTRVFLDAGPPVSFPEEVWKQIDVVRMNAREAATVSCIEVRDAKTARQAARYVLERGVQAAAIEAGSEGNLLMWQDGEVLLPIIPVKTRDRTGAGDAFIAGLAVAKLDGRPWAEAGRFANAASAHTTTRLGAEPGLPRREDVLSLLREHIDK